MVNENIDVKNWVELLGRRYFLKDNRKKIETEEEIFLAFEESTEITIDYHKESLLKAVHELEKLRFFSEEQWKDELKKVNAEEVKRTDKLNKEAAEIKEKNEKRRKVLSELLQKDIAESTREVIKRELQYLNLDLVRRKEERHVPWIYDCTKIIDIEEFKKGIFKELLWTIDYHRKGIVKEQIEQSKKYKQFLKDIKEFFS